MSILSKNQKIEYCSYSNTIRLQPENQLLLVDICESPGFSRWVGDFDGAISTKLALAITACIVDKNRIQRFKIGEILADYLNNALH